MNYFQKRDGIMVCKFMNSEPRWINSENPNGEKGKGAIENNGAIGYACEHFYSGEEYVFLLRI